MNLGVGGVFVLAQLSEEQVVGAQGLQRRSKRIVSDTVAKQACASNIGHHPHHPPSSPAAQHAD